ncbi:hypothetical protein [Actinoplanes derwentensis]|uniref:hypothetical protein n=1 Tax=Actinoplanes derwentensis TaxID=113562 RepID=UPI0012FD884F|nr:hypothetical protein [Actinoplanes derwentensis]
MQAGVSPADHIVVDPIRDDHRDQCDLRADIPQSPLDHIRVEQPVGVVTSRPVAGARRRRRIDRQGTDVQADPKPQWLLAGAVVAKLRKPLLEQHRERVDEGRQDARRQPGGEPVARVTEEVRGGPILLKPGIAHRVADDCLDGGGRLLVDAAGKLGEVLGVHGENRSIRRQWTGWNMARRHRPGPFQR